MLQRKENRVKCHREGLPWWSSGDVSKLPMQKTPQNKTPNARGPSLIPSQGTRSYMPQLKILSATTKIWCGQINNKFFRMPQTGQVKWRLNWPLWWKYFKTDSSGGCTHLWITLKTIKLYVHFKWVSCMICELYFNKTITEEKKNWPLGLAMWVHW